MNAFWAGLGLGLSLIVAIGAQNAYVLRQGLRRAHVGPVVAVCIGSDVVLIVAGVAGFGALVGQAPGLLGAVRLAGAAFLLVYGLLAARRVLLPATSAVEGPPTAGSRRAAVATALALTWLNPHVYLDTVLLLGGYAATYGPRRGVFAAGAVLGSVAWFLALGFGARWLRPLFTRPAAWRVLDAVIAMVMVGLAVALLAG